MVALTAAKEAFRDYSHKFSAWDATTLHAINHHSARTARVATLRARLRNFVDGPPRHVLAYQHVLEE
ncbi:MAG: hypothetical protein JWP34_4866 [Massilia sp.]|nr:hypothetical protein [Massilia sp.]